MTPIDEYRLKLIWDLVTLQMAHEHRASTGEETDAETHRFRLEQYRRAAELGVPIPVIPPGPCWTLH